MIKFRHNISETSVEILSPILFYVSICSISQIMYLQLVSVVNLDFFQT